MAGVAIVGAGGVLGTRLVEQALETTDEPVYAFTHGAIPPVAAATVPRVTWEPLDIADASAVRAALERVRPGAVINSAAMTNVDACEREREPAWAANAAGPRWLAESCVRLGAALLHVSTDYVFPGDDAAPGPYFEEAPVRPVNYYGWTKLEGEWAVRRICADRVPWLIARTALVYGYVPGGRTNFIAWLIGELRAGKRVKVVNDQVNTPTLADDLAVALLHLTHQGTTGILHVAGPDLVRRDEWARAIAAHYGLDLGLIDVISTAALHQRATRPLHSGLRTRRTDLEGVCLRGIRAGLEALEAHQHR